MQNSNLKDLISIIDNKLVIEDIIFEYVNLEKRGSNYFGICPFHTDTNPSMSVSPTKKIYKCFSCGASGNAINFVQNYEGITFIETLKKLSEKYHIDWKNYINIKSNIDPEIENIKKINNELLKYFKYNLDNEIKKNKNLKKYLFFRKITKKEIEYFKIGFAKKNDGEGIFNYLINRNFKEEEILKIGIFKNINGKLRSIFFNRIMFPILDDNDDVLGFSGRVYEGEENIKYLNSRENKLFKKSEIIYNLNNAKKLIFQKKKIIMVEGFMDVISLMKYDIKNVIATMGTSLSENQIKKISSLTNEVLLSLDFDEPGIKATIEIGKKLLRKNFKIKILNFNLPVKDVDELINSKYINNIESLNLFFEQNSISFLDFYFEKYLKKINRLNFNNNEIKKIFNIFLDNNDQIKNKLLISDIEKRLKELLNVEIKYKDLNFNSGIYDKNKKNEKINKKNNLNLKIFNLEKKIFNKIFEDKNNIITIKENYFFQNYVLRSIFDKILLIVDFNEKSEKIIKISYFIENVFSEFEVNFIFENELEKNNKEKIELIELIEKAKMYLNNLNLIKFMEKFNNEDDINEKNNLLKHIKRIKSETND